MPHSRIIGKVDCFSRHYTSTAQSDTTRILQETYVGLFKFLETLEQKGLATLITYFSGTNGTGTGKDYWDTANAAGNNSFSVWRFNQYRDRNWEWYLYVHYMTGRDYQTSTNSIPTRVDNGTIEANANDCSIVVQAAFSISGSSSVNPWNGTINLSGAAYKTNPVWSTGSSNHEVFVFPRINNISGAFSTSKDLCMSIRNYRAAFGNCFSRYHFMSDGHGLLFINESKGNGDGSSKNISGVSYVGPFRLNKNITDYNQGNLLGGTSSLGFLCFTTTRNNNVASNNGFTDAPANTILESTVFGNLVANIASYQGGVFATKQTGVRNGLLSNDSATVTTTFMPNVFLPLNAIEERGYTVYSSETPFNGLLGFLETPLLRCIVGNYASYDKANDGNRVVFGGAWLTDGNRKITTPWTGYSPGKNFTKEGIEFDILKSYW